jgi:hypothetical protein
LGYGQKENTWGSNLGDASNQIVGMKHVKLVLLLPFPANEDVNNLGAK